MPGTPALLAGSASTVLAARVAHALDVPLGRSRVERFPDGELVVRLDEPVRGRQAFVIQSTSPPVNDHLVELLAFADACRRASAARIVAVIPYFGYGRSDRRNRRNEPILGSLVAELLQCAGCDHVVLVDVHTPQTEGFFHTAVDTLSAVSLLAQAAAVHLPAKAVVVSPDAGRVKMATRYAELLNRPLAILHKRRTSGTETRATHLVGNVRDRVCLLIDDMISTGGTLVESARALRHAGAGDVLVAATHALMVGDACARLASEGITRVLHTDTVVPRRDCDVPRDCVSVAPVLAEALRAAM